MSLYATYPDGELVSLLQKGDEKAFEEIYARYWEKLSVYVLKAIRSQEDAMDIVQEVFISIWKRRDTIQIPGPLAAYLYRSVRNGSISYIERHLKEQGFLTSLAAHAAHLDLTHAPSVLEVTELEQRLNAAINRLPVKMQEIFRLSRFENRSYREIAEALGIAETTVKKQVSNALKSIRSDLGGMPASSILALAWLLHQRP